MQDFVEAAKRAAANAAERAAWEANRLRRINERQHALDLARRERAALIEQIAGMALDLERRGQLTQEPLLALARRLRALDHELNNGSAEVQAIRTEAYRPGSMNGTSVRPAPPAPRASAAAPRLGPGEHPCPTCGQPVRDTAAYCSACGTRLR